MRTPRTASKTTPYDRGSAKRRTPRSTAAKTPVSSHSEPVQAKAPSSAAKASANRVDDEPPFSKRTADGAKPKPRRLSATVPVSAEDLAKLLSQVALLPGLHSHVPASNQAKALMQEPASVKKRAIETSPVADTVPSTPGSARARAALDVTLHLVDTLVLGPCCRHAA